MENEMNITNAQYSVDIDNNNCSIKATINGIYHSIPLDPDNTQYAEILKQVADGTLTIADAD